MDHWRLRSLPGDDPGPSIGRRRFLKIASGALLALSAGATGLGVADRHVRAESESPTEWEESEPPTPFGRIATWWAQSVRETPTLTGPSVATKRRDDVINLYAQVEGEAPWPTNPTWFRTGKEPLPAGHPENILGTRWLGFEDTEDYEGLGIHGTTNPTDLGAESSAGCVRLRKDDVELLFDFVDLRTNVVIRA